MLGKLLRIIYGKRFIKVIFSLNLNYLFHLIITILNYVSLKIF
jgi:hypothetical protein